MSYKVDNAIIMAAGMSSRFAPLSYERPKALITVCGEVLIERQIGQLKEAGVKEIIVVVGYKAEEFEYLRNKFGVKLIYNKEYANRNNHYSLYLAKEYLKNTYICSADNYFSINPFEDIVEESYYASVFDEGETKEWCIYYDERGYINKTSIGGVDSWIMLGHAFFSEEYSRNFIGILENEIHHPETKKKLWEQVYVEHINELSMKIRKYNKTNIYEFDSLDELREFDTSYVDNTNSKILKKLACELRCREKDIKDCLPIVDESNQTKGFSFCIGNDMYLYDYREGKWEKKNEE